MKIEFDLAKDAVNFAKHGVSLGRAAELVIFAIEPDQRQDYGEGRYRAFGVLDGTAYCLAFTLRGSTMRAISLRRARLKEFRRHVAHP
ncbi:MAG: BrnT family toxin [Caulobacteraceae bacterium]|nr:BrnT family toxin [Caulobacteraceae bacterium]